MKAFIRCLILIAVTAFSGTTWGHGFNFDLTDSSGTYSITPFSLEDQLDSFGTPGTSGTEANNLFYETFSGTSTTTFGAPFYSVDHGFVAAGSGPWPPPTIAMYPNLGFTATFNMISPLYFSDGTAGAVPASSGTYIQMYDRDIGVADDPGTSPGYVTISGSTPFAAGFGVSLDDPHEIEKDLYIAPGSTQTYGEYGFAYDVTVTFNSGQTITTGPLVDVFAMSDPSLGDFSDNAYYTQQDAATTAIYNAAMSAGTAVLGTTSSWSGAADNTWNNSANWEAGAVPGSTSGTTSNDTVVFYSGTTTPVIDPGRNVQTILFESLNAGALTLGTTTGNALLLTAGGSIQVTAWVVSPQTVNAPLVLEGANALYTFNSNSTTTAATLNFGGNITGGAAGSTVLTLGGDNTGANTISGVISNGAANSLALLESGPCNWVLTGQNTYTGGTTVNQGTLTVTATGTLGSSMSPLTISTAANGIAATVNINGNQSVGTLSGTILGGGTTGTLNIAAGSSLTVNQATSADFGATLNIAAGTPGSFGTFALQGPSTLEIDAPPTLGDYSAINVNGGTLRFNLTSGAPVIGSGVTFTVANGATMQLAGSVSPLTGGRSVNMIDDGVLDASNYANTVNSLTVGSGGTLDVGIGNLLTSTGTASFGGMLNISGTISGSPSSVELIAYNGTATGAFTSSTNFPGYALVYSSGQLDLMPFSIFNSASGNTTTVTGAVGFTGAAGGPPLQLTGGGTTVIDGPVQFNGAQVQVNNGSSLTINGQPTFDSGTVAVNSGRMTINNNTSNAASGTSSVPITVASAATLQLAGTASALTNSVNVVNNGSTADGGGLSVTGTNQTVGTITGAPSSTGGVTTYGGDTVVGNGTAAASLTATQILQNTLTINAGSTVTIQPSGSGISEAVSSDIAASSGVLTATDDNVVTDLAIDSGADPFIAIQAAIASGAISSQTGQRLENRIAAILRLQANDPSLDAGVLEDSVLAAIPSSDWTAAPLPGEADSGVVAADLDAGTLSDSTAGSLDGSSEWVASSGNGAMAVPEPAAFLLAAIAGLAIAFAARTRGVRPRVCRPVL